MTGIDTIAIVLGSGVLLLGVIVWLALRKGRADAQVDILTADRTAATSAADVGDNVARLSDDDARRLLAQWERGAMLGDAADTSKPK